MGIKFFIAKTHGKKHEIKYDLFGIICDRQDCQVHGYPLELGDDNEVMVRWDSYHLEYSELENTRMSEAVQWLKELYPEIVEKEDCDQIKTMKDLEKLFNI